MPGFAARTRRAARYINYLIRPRSVLPHSLSPTRRLSLPQLELLLDDPWYHDFSILGLPTPQRPGIFGPNQMAKQEPLFRFIDRAIALARARGPTVTGVELFCADAFYSNYAIARGADFMLGIDSDSPSLEKARLATTLLNHRSRLAFRQCDVFDLDSDHQFGICAGGLYHLTDPPMLLAKLASHVSVALVVQTVYSLANTSPDYFESPAPGWSWGCRFSYTYLLRMIAASGWSVLSAYRNQLLGNDRLEDRGSAYLLCEPTEPHASA